MAKAKREMQSRLKLADVIIEVLDARAPFSTQNPDLHAMTAGKPRVAVLNKEDLANPKASLHWLSHFAAAGVIAVPFSAIKSGKHAQLLSALNRAASGVVEKWAKKGAVRPVRAMVVGIPNVGKSSVINALSGQARTKVGASPGVTRGQQWVRIAHNLELMDTPGVLWPKFEDVRVARHLAYLNAIRSEVLEAIPLAQELIDEVRKIAPGAISLRYKQPESGLSADVLARIATARGLLLRAGALDLERAANIVLDEFRAGKTGRITLEWPQEETGDDTAGA
jgi:ribosome biogenesis GTPase A